MKPYCTCLLLHFTGGRGDIEGKGGRGGGKGKDGKLCTYDGEDLKGKLEEGGMYMRRIYVAKEKGYRGKTGKENGRNKGWRALVHVKVWILRET